MALDPSLKRLADEVDAARAQALQAHLAGRLTADELTLATAPVEDPARTQLRFEALNAGAFCLRFNGAFS